MRKKPEKELFTEPEWKLVEKLQTPAKVQRFFSSMPYNWERERGTMRSFREVIKRNEAHCLEAAVGAAVILEQHGYPPLLLDIESQDLVDFSGRIKGYGPANLYDQGNYDWRFSPRKMSKIEDYLRALPHRRLHSSDKRYETLLDRYHRFKKRFPDRSPKYYDNRDQWMI